MEAIKIEPIEDELIYTIGRDSIGWYILWISTTKKTPTAFWKSIMEHKAYITKCETEEACKEVIENYIQNGWFLAYEG